LHLNILQVKPSFNTTVGFKFAAKVYIIKIAVKKKVGLRKYQGDFAGEKGNVKKEFGVEMVCSRHDVKVRIGREVAS
jgi:hypothetical protein